MTEAIEAKPLVALRDVSKYFGAGQTRVDALISVTMSVAPGEVVGLLGPSGSGKTTLLNVVGCVIEPSGGWVCLDGEVVYEQRWLRSDLRRLRLEKIGFIFQVANLLPFLSSVENVMEVMELAGAASASARTRAIALLDYLDVGHRKNAMPAQLSGGEAQRVAIARALANQPRIILADEPTATLDSERAGIVLDLLRKVASDRQAAVICVTHDENIFNRFDRIFRLRDGRVVSVSENSAAPRQARPLATLR
jgi:putative ABC transport system ATP-binding protein